MCSNGPILINFHKVLVTSAVLGKATRVDLYRPTSSTTILPLPLNCWGLCVNMRMGIDVATRLLHFMSKKWEQEDPIQPQHDLAMDASFVHLYHALHTSLFIACNVAFAVQSNLLTIHSLPFNIYIYAQKGNISPFTHTHTTHTHTQNL